MTKTFSAFLGVVVDMALVQLCLQFYTGSIGVDIRKDVSPEKNTLNNIEKSIMSMAASRKTKGWSNSL